MHHFDDPAYSYPIPTDPHTQHHLQSALPNHTIGLNSYMHFSPVD